MVPRGAQAAAVSRGLGGRSMRGACLALALLSAGCATPPRPVEGPPAWAGRRVGAPPLPDPALRQAVVARAIREWEFFGRQTVVFRGPEESIPRVGAWEDDEGDFSARVNLYWRAVGRPGVDGMDCQQPWSAAFLSWVMQDAGVPDDEFPPAAAHGTYLAHILNGASEPGRFFVPRYVKDYSPVPGDLICAYRGPAAPAAFGDFVRPDAFRGTNTHCDLVVAKGGQILEAIGGNVRNSVSKSVLELDAAGLLEGVPRRSWFLILQNRL